MSFEISREQYASLYGPTTGDAIRLADTELFAVVEEDLTTPGEEAVFGGGKVIRDRLMDQTARPSILRRLLGQTPAARRPGA